VRSLRGQDRIARFSPRAVALAVAVVVLAAAVAVGVLSAADDGTVDPGPPSGSELVGGKRLQSGRCSDWLRAGAREREATVGALAYDTAGPTPYGPATTLPSRDAFALLDRMCAQPQAAAWSLYQLYTRSAAFQHAPDRFQ
jgi:hypothetical protein